MLIQVQTQSKDSPILILIQVQSTDSQILFQSQSKTKANPVLVQCQSKRKSRLHPYLLHDQASLPCRPKLVSQNIISWKDHGILLGKEMKFR